MDHEKIKRRQSLRVIISEAIMVLAVVVLVAVLAFVVSGYWLNSDFKVERQGLLQVYSVPTGANVEIDGESSWLQRTNTSKTLSGGKHTVKLSKEGYDSWSKEINVADGLLYRLHYPRLFLMERSAEKVYKTPGTIFATISPDHNTLLLVDGTTSWSIINLTDETIKPKKIDIAEYFSGVSIAEGAKVGLFDSEILAADWDADGSHILFKVDNNGSVEWILVDINSVKNSINLSKEFGANFTDIQILDNSASNLLVVQNQNLHKIDLSSKSISSVLVEGVVDFDHYQNEIIYAQKDSNAKYSVRSMKLGDEKTTKIAEPEEPVQVAISKFYDNIYFAVIRDRTLSLAKKADTLEFQDFVIDFWPESVKVGRDGGFIAMHAGSQVATLDMEANAIYEWEIEGVNFGWLDHNMIYSVLDGELVVYDFDGLNRRVLSKNVSDHFPATITGDKWLYYFSDDNLVREWIVEH